MRRAGHCTTVDGEMLGSLLALVVLLDAWWGALKRALATLRMGGTRVEDTRVLMWHRCLFHFSWGLVEGGWLSDTPLATDTGVWSVHSKRIQHLCICQPVGRLEYLKVPLRRTSAPQRPPQGPVLPHASHQAKPLNLTAETDEPLSSSSGRRHSPDHVAL